jgi:hypothetical protein
MHVASAADWHTKALRCGGKSCGCLPVNGSVRYTCSRRRSDVRSRQHWCLETDVVQRIMRRGAARREMRWCPGTKLGSRLSEIPQQRCVRAFDSVSGEHRSSRRGCLSAITAPKLGRVKGDIADRQESIGCCCGCFQVPDLLIA